MDHTTKDSAPLTPVETEMGENTSSFMPLLKLAEEEPKLPPAAPVSETAPEAPIEDAPVSPDRYQGLDPLYQSPFLAKLSEAESIDDTLAIIHTNREEAFQMVNSINTVSTENAIFKEMVNVHGPEKSLRWLAFTANAIDHLVHENVLDATVAHPGARWLQGIFNNGMVMTPGRRGVEETKTNGEKTRLTGIQAMVRARRVMCMGDYHSIPLPHSGIWVTLKIAGDDEYVDMQTAIMNDKTLIGRRTNGLVFSNLDVIVRKHMIDFLLGMVCESSIGITDKSKLLALIKEPDIDILAQGYLAGRFRKGYKLTQVCQANPAACVHDETELASINKLLIIDNARLSNEQLAHMQKIEGRTVEQVLAYQVAFEHHRNNVVDLSDDVKVYFRIPTLEDKLTEGFTWIDSVTSALSTTFNDSLSREQREQYVNKQISLSAMRIYGHWVSRIEYADGGYVDSREDIASLLVEFGMDETLRDAFFKKMKAFVAESTIGIMGVPRWTCPVCQKEQPKVSEYFPAYTPLNVGKVFFTLTTNTLTKIFQKTDI